MSTLFLVRHGQTALNAAGRFRGRLDPPLDTHGVEQTEAAARRIAPAGPVAVYASPLRRTVETAQVIAGRCGLAVAKVPGLVDVDYGAWEGLTWEEATAADPDAAAVFQNDPHAATPPGGEPVASVETRVMRTLHQLTDNEPAVVVAVTHEIPLRLVMAGLLGLPGAETWQLDVPPGSVAQLDTDHGKLRVADLPDSD